MYLILYSFGVRCELEVFLVLNPFIEKSMPPQNNIFILLSRKCPTIAKKFISIGNRLGTRQVRNAAWTVSAPPLMQSLLQKHMKKNKENV